MSDRSFVRPSVRHEVEENWIFTASIQEKRPKLNIPIIMSVYDTQTDMETNTHPVTLINILGC